jgi:hypothetical protein
MTGSNNPARMPMMVITTSNSINVNAPSFRGGSEDSFFILVPYIVRTFWKRSNPSARRHPIIAKGGCGRPGPERHGGHAN